MSSPAFQFYPADFLAEENVVLMSNQEIGCYIKLMCYCWREGSIPADVNKIARLCGEDSSAMAQLWIAIKECFAELEADPKRLVHPRLEKERIKQEEHKKERAESGKKGAKARWGAAPKEDSSAMAQPLPKPMANDGSSSSTSSSNKKHTAALSLLISHGIPQNLANDWLTIRKSKNQPLTETCLKATIREAEKAGLTLEQAITVACENSWAGFKASYLDDKKGFTPARGVNTAMDDNTLVAKARELGIDTYKQSKNDLVSKINKKLGVA